MSRKQISLAPHDTKWADAFKIAQAFLNEHSSIQLELHHIGSTSISGIDAKPILDILGVVTSIEAFDQCRIKMESLGFVWKGEYGIPGRRYCILYDETDESTLIHFHVFQKSDPEVEKHLVFRDYLMDAPGAARRYENLKRGLTHSLSEQTKYSEAKAPLIGQLLQEAYAWRIASKSKRLVVAAIIRKENKFLLGKRASTKKSAPGFWSPICGHIEVDETPAQAVVREVFEEIGLVVEPVEQVAEFDTRDKSALILWWTVDVLSGDAQIRNDEHSEIRWLTVDEMEKLDQVFSEDIELFRKIEALDK